MRHTPWALALLALSLPAPALSDPLQRLNITNAAWNQAYGDRYADPGDARTTDRPWQRYRDRPEIAVDDWPRLSWRERAAYGLLGRPAYLNGYDEAPYGGDGYGYRPGRPYPLAVVPTTPQPLRRCGPGPALVGAAIGGGLGAALSDGSRQRQWALPIGATVGGLLGGVLAGC